MAPDVPTLDLAEMHVRDGLEELEEPCVVALRLWAGARAFVDATAGSTRHRHDPAAVLYAVGTARNAGLPLSARLLSLG